MAAASRTCSGLSDSSKADREQPQSHYRERGSRQHPCHLRELHREAMSHEEQTSKSLKDGLRLVSVMLIFGEFDCVHIPWRWKGRDSVYHQMDKH